MPGKALGGQFSRRLTSGANLVTHLAAVSMVVEDVEVRADLTTWRNLETGRENEATEVTKLIGHLSTFEVHNRVRVVFLPLSMNALVHRSKSNSVEFTWDVESRVSNVVTWVGLVDGIETNDSRVVSELLGNARPRGNKFILETILVLVKSIESVQVLNRWEVIREDNLLAISDNRIIVLIHLVVVIVRVMKRFAETKFLHDRFEKGISIFTNANWVVTDGLLGVEIGHTLTTHVSSENILVSVDKNVDASISESVDKVKNLIKVSVVVDTGNALNTFPHDTESHKVHTPFLEFLNIVIIERKIRIKITIAGYIRWHLVHGVDTVENDGLTFLVFEHSGVRVDSKSADSFNCASSKS
jgi:hypothetical protein